MGELRKFEAWKKLLTSREIMSNMLELKVRSKCAALEFISLQKAVAVCLFL